ncbi:MAG: cytochrome c biogenesis protein CcsA, partial [Phycisphaerales bacterium]|nr:cytochrome c biogenesis protein CcsA [Phycisphaerales bacterium]
MISYGAFYAAFCTAILWLAIWRKRESKKMLDQLAYHMMAFGFLMLTLGIISGAIWAKQAWGRYWGWDPKETWALISIIVYFILLHARHIGWLRDFGLAVSSILAFLCIVWTFYGVNYVMASGLHSYGFGSGGEVWVAIWALAELVFLAICRMRYSLLRLGRNATDVSAPHDDNAPTIA